jgi:hypothetical protein
MIVLLLRQIALFSIVAAQSLSHLFSPRLGYFSSFSKNLVVKDRAFPSLDALIEVLCQGPGELADDPERLRSLTGFPHLNVTI